MQNVSNEEIKERFAVAPSLTVTELCDILVELTPARRRATLFALECNLKPAQVILLTWELAYKNARTDFSIQILRSQPRHLKLNYAFWENLQDSAIAAPIFGFDQQIESIHSDFNLLLRRYKNLILIDTETDKLHFMQKMQL